MNIIIFNIPVRCYTTFFIYFPLVSCIKLICLIDIRNGICFSIVEDRLSFRIILFLYTSSTGDIVFCRCNLYFCATVFINIINFLYKPLTERFCSYNDRPIQILECTGNNFRSTGTSPIYQNGKRDI